MGGATLTSGRTFWPTLSCLVVPPCMLVLLTGCRRKSPLLLLPLLRSRSSLHLRGSTPSGSVVPSLVLCPPSRTCGSPRRSTTSLALASFTANVSNFRILSTHSWYI